MATPFAKVTFPVLTRFLPQMAVHELLGESVPLIGDLVTFDDAESCGDCSDRTERNDRRRFRRMGLEVKVRRGIRLPDPV